MISLPNIQVTNFVFALQRGANFLDSPTELYEGRVVSREQSWRNGVIRTMSNDQRKGET